MANLQEILYKVSIRSIIGPRDKAIDNLQTDSRLAGPGTLFIALKGTPTDGHQYIPAVSAAGAVAVVCENLPADLREGIYYIQADDSASSGGSIWQNFYGQPSHKLS